MESNQSRLTLFASVRREHYALIRGWYLIGITHGSLIHLTALLSNKPQKCVSHSKRYVISLARPSHTQKQFSDSNILPLSLSLSLSICLISIRDVPFSSYHFSLHLPWLREPEDEIYKDNPMSAYNDSNKTELCESSGLMETRDPNWRILLELCAISVHEMGRTPRAGLRDWVHSPTNKFWT